MSEPDMQAVKKKTKRGGKGKRKVQEIDGASQEASVSHAAGMHNTLYTTHTDTNSHTHTHTKLTQTHTHTYTHIHTNSHKIGRAHV